MTPWTIACQAPLSMGFPRQEYWSRLPFPSPRDLSDPGIEPGSPALQADSLPTELRQGESLKMRQFNPMSDSEIIASIYFFLSTTFSILILDLVLVAQLVKNLPAMWETSVQSLGWEDSLEKGKASHSIFLAWRIPWTVQSWRSPWTV